ncbi:methyltransferase domain-containing protein [Pelagibacterales bacterium SAG-MED15]|nr:methyltransferase domain-containing protein [Pelagibacterales bacterium SAG-MED15]
MSKKIEKCRNCKSKNLINLFSLGKLRFTGKFPSKKQNVPFGEITLVMCNKCKLVQLNKNFSLKYLYNKDYGYRTGVNRTMTKHVHDVVKNLQKKVKIKKNDNVLDIASNDGTLLSFYNKKTISWGIDPILNKYKKNYNKIDYGVNDFFNLKSINRINKKVKFKIITALAVFYDLEDPNIFLNAINKLLDKNGIFYLEFQDLLKIIKNNMFDTICHEHLEYYSVTFINNILRKHNLRLFDHKYNEINGGSSSYFICHKDSVYKTNKIKINKILQNESKANIHSRSTYIKFKNKIDQCKKSLNNLIVKIKKEKKIIHGYAASTKGNVLLQYFNLNNKKIDYISDRNPLKQNLYTPGTKIKIISEKLSRNLKPSYYLVLAWHFKKEILLREKEVRKKGTKFIFPLPTLKII